MTVMASWRPAQPGEPDGPEERFYRLFSEADPATARNLIDRFAEVWLPLAGLPSRRIVEVPDTVELKFRDDNGERTLRLTSWYTGSTYWMYEWDGTLTTAMHWIEEVAELQAEIAKTERGIYGRTPWDDD